MIEDIATEVEAQDGAIFIVRNSSHPLRYFTVCSLRHDSLEPGKSGARDMRKAQEWIARLLQISDTIT
jgi:hypothetical protein